MDSGVGLEERYIQYDFLLSDHKQKIWLDALLKYSGLCVTTIASVLDVPTHVLKSVHEGSLFFRDEDANNLAAIFLMYFSGESQIT